MSRCCDRVPCSPGHVSLPVVAVLYRNSIHTGVQGNAVLRGNQVHLSLVHDAHNKIIVNAKCMGIVSNIFSLYIQWHGSNYLATHCGSNVLGIHVVDEIRVLKVLGQNETTKLLVSSSVVVTFDSFFLGGGSRQPWPAVKTVQRSDSYSFISRLYIILILWTADETSRP